MITKNKNVIKEAEGLRLDAYKDGGGVWTIGYGHTGKEVKAGYAIDMAAAEAYLSLDLQEAEDAVNKYVKVNLTQNQFDALVSLTYNIGATAFKNSTLLKLLNKGQYSDAAEEFPRWNKDNGKVVDGLSNRRLKERLLFLS